MITNYSYFWEFINDAWFSASTIIYIISRDFKDLEFCYNYTTYKLGMR